MIDNDLDLLRQELDQLERQAPQRPLITDEDVRRVMQSPRPRRRVWLVPAGIAASVALAIGVGIEVISPAPEPWEYADLTPSVETGPAPSHPQRELQPITHVVAETGHAPSLQEEAFSDPATSFPHRSPAEPIYCAEAFPEEDPGPSHASECNFDCSLLAELNINPLKIFAI